jgi:large subunit ribosomal protein L4
MKVREGLLKVLDRIDLPEPKTKQMIGLLKDLGVKKRALIILADDNTNVQLAARNLPAVKAIRVEGLNIYDLLDHDYLICAQDALVKLQERVAS